jgi:glycosyltransferase involved in cell wall biosynthesis
MLFVGRLVERKGVEVAVRALACVRRGLDARLTVIGSGSREPEIRAAISEAGIGEFVDMPGHVRASELVEAYAAADVFVLPAIVDAKGDTEGLGVVLLEALRAGVPVVASEAGGIRDIVRDGETGWLVPPGDSTALARAVLEVARNPAEAALRVGRGQALIAKSFALPRIVDRLEECYAEAVALRRPAATRGEPAARSPGANR